MHRRCSLLGWTSRPYRSDERMTSNGPTGPTLQGQALAACGIQCESFKLLETAEWQFQVPFYRRLQIEA
eukprot:7535985-Alexandrium_andersonii.AAC.1